MTAKTNSNKEARLIGLALTTALAGVALSGCAQSAPLASVSANKAEDALAKGKSKNAIQHAEAAVQAEPRNAAYRATLGAAYLDAGRFASAATTFDDAMKLGDNSPRTALSLALALAGDGKGRQAVALLDDWQSEIAASDLGLAYALAGNPGKGIDTLSNAIRNGENTAKARQNLAYSYALNGQWREARVMAAQDLGAEKVSDRIAEWAATSHPEAYRERVAALLRVIPNTGDPGQPVQLALANSAGYEQLAAEASAAALPAAPEAAPTYAAYSGSGQGYELAPIGDAPQALPAPAVEVAAYEAAPAQPGTFQAAFNASAPSGGSLAGVTMDAMRFAQEPGVQSAPARAGIAKAPKAAPKSTFAGNDAAGTHLVQLGSFLSEQGARRAWGIYVKRYPELANHDMVITQAVVKGKHYWRVSAGGFNSGSSKAMCGKVASSNGEGCFAWAEGRPMMGAIDSGRRMAMR